MGLSKFKDVTLVVARMLESGCPLWSHSLMYSSHSDDDMFSNRLHICDTRGACKRAGARGGGGGGGEVYSRRARARAARAGRACPRSARSWAARAGAGPGAAAATRRRAARRPPGSAAAPRAPPPRRPPAAALQHARSVPRPARRRPRRPPGLRRLTHEGQEVVSQHPAALALHQVLLQFVHALPLLRR